MHKSTGCEVCYAEGINKRLGTGLPFKPGHEKDIEIFLDEEMLTAPLRWRKPRMIFVCSMTDLFADFVKDEWIVQILDVIRRTSFDGGSNCGKLRGEHTYQILTKRPDRMAAFMSRLRFDQLADPDKPALYLVDPRAGGYPVILKNLWLGTSCERQQEADERIPLLLQTPAAIRFVSLEPLLGPIDLHALKTTVLRGCGPNGEDETSKLDWVIVGGESGPKARPMHPDWARSLRDQCAAAGVPFFFKQWGGWMPRTMLDAITAKHRSCAIDRDGNLPGTADDADAALARVAARPDDYQFMSAVGKKAAGRLLDGKEHNEFPATPQIQRSAA